MSSPHHVAVILDGNRRYAKKRHIAPWLGHYAGADRLYKFLEWSKQLGIRILTLYTFSFENFKRSKTELRHLFSLFLTKFSEVEKDKRLAKEGIRIRFIGTLQLFPKQLQDKMAALEAKTRRNKNYTINFAMGYSARQEIADAARAIAAKVKRGKLALSSITDSLLQKHLYLPDEPDLIIRTAGEQRLSNFLLFQGAYSELVFVNKFWPEITKKDLSACIAEYNSRIRRFGK